jgi:hypothetical protein
MVPNPSTTGDARLGVVLDVLAGHPRATVDVMMRLSGARSERVVARGVRDAPAVVRPLAGVPRSLTSEREESP